VSAVIKTKQGPKKACGQRNEALNGSLSAIGLIRGAYRGMQGGVEIMSLGLGADACLPVPSCRAQPQQSEQSTQPTSWQVGCKDYS